MTITFSTDKINNDLYIGNDGNLAIVSDLEAVLQTCEHVVKARLGEISSNIDLGIPYFETVFIGTPNLISFEASIRSAISKVPDVLAINRMSIQLINNELLYEIEIVTIYGTGVISATTI